MAVRTITTRLAIDGEREYKKQLAEVNSNLRNLKGELQLTEEQFKGQANSVEALTAKNKLLRDEIAQQRVKVESLERAVEDAAAAYGEADSRTDKYRQSLTRAKTDLLRLNNELDDNSRYLEEAKSSANGAATSIDKFGREAKDAADDVDDAGSSLTSMLGALSDLKGAIAGGAAVAGLKAVAGSITQVVEASEEYRKVMGTLETSSQQAGYTAEQTSEVYSRLQAVLGDTQTAATTTASTVPPRQAASALRSGAKNGCRFRMPRITTADGAPHMSIAAAASAGPIPNSAMASPTIQSSAAKPQP